MIRKQIHNLVIFPLVVLISITCGCSFYPYGKPTTGNRVREGLDPNIVRVINAFRNDVPKLMKKGRIPGCAIALVDREGILWVEGFGTTDYKNKIPVTPNTLFYLGSIGKTYTATAILLAVQDGLLDLDKPVTVYIPEFKVFSRYEYYPEYDIGAVVLTSRVPHSVLSDLIIGRRLIEKGVFEKHYPAPSWDTQQCRPKWTGWTEHTPTAYKPEWKKYCGKYNCRFGGYRIEWWAKLALALELDQYTPRIKVFKKNGYLCLTESRLLQLINHHPSAQVNQKLEEVEPGLFFTASGTALGLRGEIPTWRNYRLMKR